MATHKYIEGAPVRFDVPDVELPCAVCLVAKGLATRIARQPAVHRLASRRGEVLQFDGYGRISFAGLSSDLHELTICTDKYTGYEIGVPLQFKSQAANAQLSILRRLHRMVATEGGVNRIERDPGTDIDGPTFDTFCDEQGISIDEFAPGPPEPRGSIERPHQSTGHRMRAIASENNLTFARWGYISNHAADWAISHRHAMTPQCLDLKLSCSTNQNLTLLGNSTI